LNFFFGGSRTGSFSASHGIERIIAKSAWLLFTH
jgi:hypothetical protein